MHPLIFLDYSPPAQKFPLKAAEFSFKNSLFNYRRRLMTRAARCKGKGAFRFASQRRRRVFLRVPLTEKQRRGNESASKATFRGQSTA